MRLVETISPLADVTVELQDGRVTMRAKGGDAALRVRAPEHRPLGEHEPAVVLALAGEGMEADVELPAPAVDVLAAALDDVREGAPADE